MFTQSMNVKEPHCPGGHQEHLNTEQYKYSNAAAITSAVSIHAATNHCYGQADQHQQHRLNENCRVVTGGTGQAKESQGAEAKYPDSSSGDVSQLPPSNELSGNQSGAQLCARQATFPQVCFCRIKHLASSACAR